MEILRVKQHDECVTSKVHQLARDVLEYLDQFRLDLTCYQLNEDGVPHNCDYLDEQLTWRYVEEKSKAGDALAPVAVIQRSEAFGVELGFTYECHVIRGELTDGLRIAYLVPQDSRGVPVDLSPDEPTEKWALSLWERLDADPTYIAHVINGCILPRAECLQHDIAVGIRNVNERLDDRRRKVAKMFADVEGVHQVDDKEDGMTVLKIFRSVAQSWRCSYSTLR